MRKVITGFIFILFSVALVQQVFAEVITTDSLQKVEKRIKRLPYNPRDVLVVFDVDGTILDARDQILKAQNWKQWQALINAVYNKASRGLDKEAREKIWIDIISSIDNQRAPALVDDYFIKSLAYLRTKNIPAIALTHAGTGVFGKIKNTADWRVNDLKKIEVDFSYAFNSEKIQLADTSVGRYIGAPLFQSGIIFTSGHDKGEMLEKFLNAVNFKPKMIVFLDDKEKNVFSLKKYCDANNIDYLGVHYTAVANRQLVPLNYERAQFQFDYFEKKGKWLSDSEADKLYKKRFSFSE